jgi:hypothetical protein
MPDDVRALADQRVRDAIAAVNNGLVEVKVAMARRDAVLRGPPAGHA